MRTTSTGRASIGIFALGVLCLTLVAATLVGCSQSESSSASHRPAESSDDNSAPAGEFTAAPNASGQSSVQYDSDLSADGPGISNAPMPMVVPSTPSIPSLNGPKPLLPSKKQSTSKSQTQPTQVAQLPHSPLAERSDAAEEVTPEPSVEPELSALFTGNIVDVYFATDRLPTAELIPGVLRTFAPAVIVAMIACALFIGLTAARRFQSLWLVGAGLAICTSLLVLQASVIRWQQYSRLASNATTRFSTLRCDEAKAYPLHVGLATVSLPEIHKPGGFEAPSVFRLEFSEDPAKHIILQSLSIDDSSDAWFGKLSEQMDSDADRDGFVFIHGYNVKFGDALKRTAQLSHDLNIQGPSICYSWPSRGQLLSYTADEASVSWSAPHFEQLILDLRHRANCKNINIVAHSMGNRALLQALERLQLRQETPTKLINTLVLAAPDVDASEFTTRYVKPVQTIARRTTLYFSDQDIPLMVSNNLHRAPRLGFAANTLPQLDGIEAIHIGQQSLLTLGHSYYGSDVAVIDDMRSLLGEEKSAIDRQFLRSATAANGASYWQIDRALHAKLSTADLR